MKHLKDFLEGSPQNEIAITPFVGIRNKGELFYIPSSKGSVVKINTLSDGSLDISKYEGLLGNQIKYQASGKLAETTSTTKAQGTVGINSFGDATLISHEFSDGVGILTFDRDIEKMSMGCFYYIQGLTLIEIPETVLEIGGYAIIGNNDLKTLIIHGTPSILSSAFNNTPRGLEVWLYNTAYAISMANGIFRECTIYLNDQLFDGNFKAVITASMPVSYGKERVHLGHCTGILPSTLKVKITATAKSTMSGVSDVSCTDQIFTLSYDTSSQSFMGGIVNSTTIIQVSLGDIWIGINSGAPFTGTLQSIEIIN